MTNSRARQIVIDWLKANGKAVPWSGHDYTAFVTVVRKTTSIDMPETTADLFPRQQACEWLRSLARAIEAGEKIGTSLR